MSKSQSSKKRIEKRKLKDLVAFPSQKAIFFDESPEQDAALVESIRTDGLDKLPEILPEGNKAGFPANTTLAGHRRRKALLELGHQEYRVIVRYDLMEVDRFTIERMFINDNFQRRQLKGLDLARCIQRLSELEKNRAPGSLSDYEQRHVRDRVGKLVGMEGRNAVRYLNVLKAPASVQQAFDANKISLVQADKITRLPNSTQAEIDKQLRAGKAPKAVVAKYLGKTSRRPKNRGTAVSRFLKDVKKANRHLDEFDLDDYSGTLRPGEPETLRLLNKHCDTFLNADKQLKRRQSKTLAKLEGGAKEREKSTAANCDARKSKKPQSESKK